MTWHEEFRIEFPKGDQTRLYLAHALVEISGLKVDLKEAKRVMNALPLAIARRIFRIYKGQLAANRSFVTANLYRAPEPAKYMMKLEEDEVQEDDMVQKAQDRLRQQFSKEELNDAAEVDRMILNASKMKGAVKPQTDGK